MDVLGQVGQFTCVGKRGSFTAFHFGHGRVTLR